MSNQTLETTKIGNLGKVITGKTPPTVQPEFFGSEYPFITPTDIQEDSRIVETTRFLSEEGRAFQKNLLLPTGTVCFTCIGATIGKICITSEPSFTNQQINSIVVDEAQYDNRFVYYLLKQETPRIKVHAGGAATPIISKSIFSDIEVDVPPLPTQRRIADILSAYDDLIENNTRRIRVLEQMVRTVYKEWFGNFDKDSQPDGWEKIKYADLLESYSGGDWGEEQPDEKENCPALIVRGTDFPEVRMGGFVKAPTRYVSQTSLKKRRLKAGDIVAENSVNASSRCVGTTFLVTKGVLKRIGEDSICASFCKNFRLKNPSLAPLVYLHMRFLHEENLMPFYQNVAANGIGNFQAERFVNSEYIYLPKDKARLNEILETFTNLTSSTLADQIANLRQTRDLILPRLVSGDIELQ